MQTTTKYILPVFLISKHSTLRKRYQNQRLLLKTLCYTTPTLFDKLYTNLVLQSAILHSGFICKLKQPDRLLQRYKHIIVMASNFYLTLEKTLNCPVCKNLYAGPHIPKDLPHCAHTCCQPCLESIASESMIAEFSQMNCPICNTVVYVSKKQIKTLRTNIQLWNLAKDYQEHAQLKKQETLAEEVTTRMSGVRIQQNLPPYHDTYSELRNDSTTASAPLEHTYLEPMQSSATKTIERPLPQPPAYDIPKSKSALSTTPGRRDPSPQATFNIDKPVQTYSFGHFEQVQAITRTPDGLLAACDFKQSSVTIFEKKSGQYKKKTQLELAKENQHRPADIAFLTIQSVKKGSLKGLLGGSPKYVYLVARHKGVEIYTSQGKYERTISPCKTDGICSVTVTVDGHILLGDIKQFVITEHDQEGNLLQTVPVQTKPARLEALDGSRVAISHFRSGKVEIVDMATTKSILTMNIPEALGMCYLRKSDTILVCRSETSSIPGTILYDTGLVKQYCCKTGELRGTLIKDLYHPFDVTVTSEGYLAVADEKNIKIYKGNTQQVNLYEV